MEYLNSFCRYSPGDTSKEATKIKMFGQVGDSSFAGIQTRYLQPIELTLGSFQYHCPSPRIWQHIRVIHVNKKAT
jgi:hypothetical protein